jgi:hypothetical protein
MVYDVIDENSNIFKSALLQSTGGCIPVFLSAFATEL